MIDELIIARLLADVDVAALVGTRIRVDRLGQDTTFPAIRVTEITGDHPTNQAGASGLRDALVQVDIYATTPDGRRDLYLHVRDSLRGLAAAYADHADLSIRSASITSDSKTYEKDSDGSDEGLFRQQTDWRIWHTEQAAP